MGGRDQLYATLLELGPERGHLVLVQLVLMRVCLEDLLLELSELLRLVDEGTWFQFSKLGQSGHSFYFSKERAPGEAPHLLKRSRATLYSYRRTWRDF
jgi:hypothetical protein